MANGKKELATRKSETELSTVPEYLRLANTGVPAPGLENIQQGDMTIPRVALCQSMTPQRKRSDPKYIDGLEEGQFFNTVTGENYGDSVKIVPLFFYKTRLLFADIDTGGGILCQAQDGEHGLGEPGGLCSKCPKAQFTDDGSPECNHFYNYPVLVVPAKGPIGLDSLAVFSLKSSGIKVAKDWNAVMRMKGTASFASPYNVTSVEQKNTAGQTWSTPVIKGAGWIAEADLKIANECYKIVRDMQSDGRLKVDADDLAGEGREPGEEAL